MIRNTDIAEHFKEIYGCRFMYDVNGVAVWPAQAIDFTAKTQFLFRINKGIKSSWDNDKINKFVPEEDRPIPFERMVFIGDGLTDVPAMKMVKHQGGMSIGVFDGTTEQKGGTVSPKDKVLELLDQGRVDYAAPANYEDGKEIDRILKGFLRKVSLKVEMAKMGTKKVNGKDPQMKMQELEKENKDLKEKNEKLEAREKNS